MKKIGIFYGSSTGVTASVAERIAREMQIANADIHDVAKTAPDRLADYDVLLIGTSTWGDGDMQTDWYDFTDALGAVSLAGKKFAIFGCGDESMSYTFCNGMAQLQRRFSPTGAQQIGYFNADGFSWTKSEAMADDGSAIGLVLDEVNHPDLTDPKIKKWVALLKTQI